MHIRDMRTHDLKTAPPFFQDVVDGIKPFEVRFNDRDYRVGDFLRLREFDNDTYTGRVVIRRITYMLTDPQYCKDGFVVLSWAVPGEKYTSGILRCKRCGKYYPQKYISNDGSETCVNCMIQGVAKSWE